MKKSVFNFFAMLSLVILFAGCTNLLNETNKIQNDKTDSSSKTVTLKGSLALDGGASPGEFLAMVAGGSSRSAVAGGSTMDGYGFVLTATEVDTSSNANPTSINATVTDNKFSITLDADKNYIFSLTLNPSDATSSGDSLSLSISKIMFGEKEKAPESVKLNGLTKAELESAKVYFSPDTTISGTGEIALEIDTAAEKVKYVGYSFSKSDNYGYFGSGTVAFDTNKAAINVTEGAEKGAEPTPLPNGIYDFTFEFYESDPAANLEAAPTPIAITYQKINVFANFVTDTWISDGSAWFKNEDGVTKFVVSGAAIDAYKNPKEFYVKGDASNNSWGDGSDSNAGTSIKKPFNTLQQAIDRVIAANDGTSEYKIYVKGTVYPKTYTTDENGNALPAAVYKMANFNALGTETPLKLSIIGVGSDTTLSGKTSWDNDTATTYGSIVVIGDYDGDEPTNSTQIQNLNLEIENLTIKEGSVSGTGYGGGIFNNGATVTLKNCAITENTAYYGSGIYCFNGTIITNDTTIDSNGYVDGSESDYSGIVLDSSTLKVKNTLTLNKNFIQITGSSTITNVEGSDATIKCGASEDEISNQAKYGIGASVYANVTAISENEEKVTEATLNLSGSLAFKDFSTGVYLENSLGKNTKANGHLTLAGKITDLSVELFDYGLITLGENYSTDSNISVNFSGSYNSASVFINNCNEAAAKTFEVYTGCIDDNGNISYEYYTVTEDGKLKSTTFTQAVFRAYCSQLYTNGGDYSDKMTLEIPDGTTVTADDAYKYVTSIKIPECYIAIVSNNNEGGVFFDCTTHLEEVTLPDSMVIIGDYAFNNCAALTSINIPNSVTSIGTYAFNSSGLTSIEIPNSVTSIGDNAFLNCDALTTVTMLSTTPPVLGGSSVFPDSVTAIYVPAGETITVQGETISYLDVYKEDWANSGCVDKLQVLLTKEELFKIDSDYRTATTITIPESWGYTEIASDAFSECRALESVTISSTVTYIKDSAFSNCISLTTVTMNPINPPSLEMTDSTSSVFPSSVTSICLLPSSLPTGGTCLSAYQRAWSNYFTSSIFKVFLTKEEVATLAGDAWSTSTEKKITIPDNTYTVIAGDAFEDYSDLKEINIPASITLIKANAFSKCTNLTTADFTNKKWKIGTTTYDLSSLPPSYSTVADVIKAMYAFDWNLVTE